VESAAGALKVEVAVMGRPGNGGQVAAKSVRLNGIARRSWEAAGAFMAVLFTVRDLDLITGAPSVRRRYLDGALSRLDSAYGAARQRFEKVLLQRNHLLKRIREGAAQRGELPFWDEELAKHGGYLFWSRAQHLEALQTRAAEAHAALGGGEVLALHYLPRLDAGAAAIGSAEDATAALAAELESTLPRQVGAGFTTVGPHRDDIDFTLDGVPAAAFGSRAQQRTAALALRLAEAHYLRDARGEPPVMLLDDIFSELDQSRRGRVMASLSGFEQVLLTTTELERVPVEIWGSARLFSVRSGSVEELRTEPTAGISET
jgi:DNA replication and repair protein RecF